MTLFLLGWGQDASARNVSSASPSAEIAPNELGRVAAEGLASRIEADLLALGFPAVEIDPRGYRSGSLNEGVVPLQVLSA